jgi:hypothetical protein
LAAGAFAQPVNQEEHASAQSIAGSRAVRHILLTRIAKFIIAPAKFTMAPAMSRHYTQSGWAPKRANFKKLTRSPRR